VGRIALAPSPPGRTQGHRTCHNVSSRAAERAFDC
jgi:hypothetical protein